MTRAVTKTLRASFIFLFIVFFCGLSLLPQIARAQVVTATIKGLNEPFDVALTPNGEYAYVTNANEGGGGGSVSVINTANATSPTPTATAPIIVFGGVDWVIVVIVIIVVTVIIFLAWHRNLRKLRVTMKNSQSHSTSGATA